MTDQCPCEGLFNSMYDHDIDFDLGQQHQLMTTAQDDIRRTLRPLFMRNFELLMESKRLVVITALGSAADLKAAKVIIQRVIDKQLGSCIQSILRAGSHLQPGSKSMKEILLNEPMNELSTNKGQQPDVLLGKRCLLNLPNEIVLTDSGEEPKKSPESLAIPKPDSQITRTENELLDQRIDYGSRR